MKKILIAVMTISSLVSVTNCRQDFQEINTNPNLTTTPTTYGLFNSATKELMDISRGSFSSARMALPWVQYSAQRNYTEEDRFQFREDVNQSLFRDYYRVALDFKKIIEFNTNPSTAAQNEVYGPKNNQIAVSRIFLSYIFHNLADTWGDIPYYSYGSKDPDFQALNLEGNITQPKFASQAKVYADILKELKEAAEMIDTSKPIFYKKSSFDGENIFSGSSSKLKRFANSLRLRVATRVKGVVPGAEQHISEAIASGVMQSNSDNVGVKYQDDSVLPAPQYSAFFISNRTDYSPSNTLIDFLKGELGEFGVDPRLQKYAAPIGTARNSIPQKTYTESTDLKKYKGMPYGIKSSQTASQRSSTSLFSYEVLRKDYTEIFMEYSEVCFLLSEANGWDETWYKKGVKASMDKWGVDEAKSTAFVNSLPAANKANVITQKYAALFMQPYEAWAELRRTGYPEHLLKVNGTYKLNTTGDYTFTALLGLTDVPSRLTYPTSLSSLNPDNYKAAQAAVGGDKLDTKLIWDKN